MVEYLVTLTRSAEKELDSLDATLVRRIFPKIEALANDPRPHGCRKLHSEKYMWKIVFTLSICIVISMSGCIKPPEDTKHGFTAMAKYGAALNISRTWKNDTELWGARGTNGFNGGRADKWSYSFISQSTAHQDMNHTYYGLIHIQMSSNGKYTTYFGNHTDNQTIINWTIDSDKAFQLMMDRYDIEGYIESRGVSLAEFHLTSPYHSSELHFGPYSGPEDAIWHAQWQRSPEFVGPYSKDAYASAHDETG